MWAWALSKLGMTALSGSLQAFGLPVVFVLVGAASGYIFGDWKNQRTIAKKDLEILTLRSDMKLLTQSSINQQRNLDAIKAENAKAANDAQAIIDGLSKRLKRRPVSTKVRLETRNVYIESKCMRNQNRDAAAAGSGMPKTPGSDHPAIDPSAIAAQADIDATWEQAGACIGTLKALIGKPVVLKIEER